MGKSESKLKFNRDIYNRKAIFSEIRPFCHLAKEHDYMEICEWENGEGFDVEISSSAATRFQITWGEYDLLKKLIKCINKHEA